MRGTQQVEAWVALTRGRLNVPIDDWCTVDGPSSTTKEQKLVVCQ